MDDNIHNITNLPKSNCPKHKHIDVLLILKSVKFEADVCPVLSNTHIR